MLFTCPTRETRKLHISQRTLHASDILLIVNWIGYKRCSLRSLMPVVRSRAIMRSLPIKFRRNIITHNKNANTYIQIFVFKYYPSMYNFTVKMSTDNSTSEKRDFTEYIKIEFSFYSKCTYVWNQNLIFYQKEFLVITRHGSSKSGPKNEEFVRFNHSTLLIYLWRLNYTHNSVDDGMRYGRFLKKKKTDEIK